MHSNRSCENCWWVNEKKHCLFLEELRFLDKDYSEDKNLCWGWRPIKKEEKIEYFEKYGREVERIGILPQIY
ncbi:hypothetical protein [Bacillus sp. FJAT-45350]|uniref:hypothetical protein n=1 Tax=Bacillus sp. FJAT-45350 TaxID=2011014 RepID=UPI000BB819E1|nr:hypothetical protein [Bacillus sp. FJAT-45350]